MNAPVFEPPRKRLRQHPSVFIAACVEASMMIVVIIVKRLGRSPSLRITKEQAAENRARVVDAATELFREKGFDAVGVAELMRAAGMTHGGFYNHFESKEALEAAACEGVFAKSVAKLESVAQTPDEEERRRAFEDYRTRYVSQ